MSQNETACGVEVYLTPEAERALVNRLSRIAGHVNGIKEMLLDHKDCDSILIQIAAVKSAMNQVALNLLDNHIETCVSDALDKGDSKMALEQLQRSVAALLKQT